MENFFQQVYFDNTIQQYALIAGIILVVFLFKRYIAHYVASFFFFLLKRRYRNLDDVSFKGLIAKPLGLFIATFITIVALDKLHFPKELDIKIYRMGLQELLRMIGSGLIIITFFRFLIKSVDFIILLIRERYLRSGDNSSHQLVFFFKDFIKVVIGIVGVLLLLKYTFKYDIKGLITGLSIVGAAIALALKESLENLIASFIIFFDKPFQTGDVVKGSNFSGTVEKIGLRSTRIRTDAKTYITVPNKQMVDSVLDNHSKRTQFRADLRIEIMVNTSAAQVNALLNGMREILTQKEVSHFNLYLSDITAHALIITSDYYANNVSAINFPVLKEKINLDIITLIEQLGIEISGKSTHISIMNQPPAT